MIALFLLACQCSQPAPEAPSTSVSLVFGGDVILGRRLNVAVYKGNRWFGPDASALLKDADVALVNAEGVIAQGGVYWDKGENRPYTFRVHPKGLKQLQDVGVDVVTVGNNHSMDYGPKALREMLDRLLLAGIDYTGGGYDAADAKRAAYIERNGVVVAIVGADLTQSAPYAAKKKRAGTLYGPGMRPGKKDKVVAMLSERLAEAREHAHVVLLSPHWGQNGKTEPQEATRALARDLIAAGYDGILGHSAHFLQGIEIIDGKPVIYDAGNLLTDAGGTAREGNRSALFRLELDARGVTRVEAHPMALGARKTKRATGKAAQTILDALTKRSGALGTTLTVADGVASVACDPGAAVLPADPKAPARTPPAKVRKAPHERTQPMPETATKVDARWANGMRLLGYELLVDELKQPKGGQVVSTWWTTDRAIEDSLQIRTKAVGSKADRQDHLPADWMWPTTRWKPDKVVHDRVLVRLTGKPEGDVKFFTGLKDAPVSCDCTLVDGLVPIGVATYTKGAGSLFDVLHPPKAKSKTKSTPVKLKLKKAP